MPGSCHHGDRTKVTQKGPVPKSRTCRSSSPQTRRPLRHESKGRLRKPAARLRLSRLWLSLTPLNSEGAQPASLHPLLSPVTLRLVYISCLTALSVLLKPTPERKQTHKQKAWKKGETAAFVTWGGWIRLVSIPGEGHFTYGGRVKIAAQLHFQK